jgi:hypothetical protein
MTAPEPRVFKPNAVFIPASAVPQKPNSGCIDPADCTLLYLDGDRLSGNLYTKEAWESDGRWDFTLRDDNYYTVGDYGEETHLCRAGLSIRDQEPVEGDRIQLLPEMWCVKQDETEYWAQEFLAEHRIKRIFGVYVFNKQAAHYLCEITPSYELRPFSSQWEPQDNFEAGEFNEGFEKVDDAIREAEADDERWSYQHVSDVKRNLETEIRQGCLPPEGKRAGGYHVEVASVTEKDAITEIEEGQSNWQL